MNIRTYELSLAQLEQAFSKSKHNKYGDEKMHRHFDELFEVFNAVKDLDFSTLDECDLIFLEKHLFTFLDKGLEFLNNSVLNICPNEILYCLKSALSDWMTDENLIIVTSLSNKRLDFSFEGDNLEQYNVLKSNIKSVFGIDLQYRLIKINLPKLLARDYLSCVVLYHELGHFVDRELNVSQMKLFLEKNRLIDFSNQYEVQELYHTMEYFADLFAAQYINDASNLYLNHIAYNNPDTVTHPATKSRIDLIYKFLADEEIDLVNQFNGVLGKIKTGLNIKKRFHPIDLNDSSFINLVPQDLNSDKELHSVFKIGWEYWLNAENNNLNSFSRTQQYHIVNNLIEKSISNYNVRQLWDKFKCV